MASCELPAASAATNFATMFPVRTLCLAGFLAAATTAWTLAEARRGFVTRLVTKVTDGKPAPKPPKGVPLKLVRYPSPAGALAAYVSTAPTDGKKRPAILWLTGGFGNDIDDLAWTPGPPDNDQSATAFREAGVLMMYPSRRGGNDNPGQMESFYGEVDDVLAARDWLAKQPGVDPERIYLGGHSTGGTLALLVAEAGGAVFRGVFVFGSALDPRNYSEDHLVYDLKNLKESELRAPSRWLAGIASPTFVFEGAEEPGNLPELQALEKRPHPDFVRFYPVAGTTHFSILRPLTRLLARKIAADDVAFTPEEIARAVQSK